MARQKREKAPRIEITKTERGLSPNTAWDQERLDAAPMGSVWSLHAEGKRSHKQLRTYWRALQGIVNATGKWPSDEHLHDEIKFTLGYRKLVADMRTGEVSEVLDSVALNEMEPDAFRAFMDSAMQLLTETTGIDALGFLEELR